MAKDTGLRDCSRAELARGVTSQRADSNYPLLFSASAPEYAAKLWDHATRNDISRLFEICLQNFSSIMGQELL